MFHALDLKSLEAKANVHSSMFTDRARQFVARHQWPLKLSPAGFEIDEFDDTCTTYCVVEERGRHQASLRLRPADAGSMVERHFSPMWRGFEDRLRGGTEVTRFCASPAMSSEERSSSVSDLLLGLCRHCQRADIGTFFGVVFPPVARVIKQAGWEPTIVCRMQDSRGVLLLAEWSASERVAWNIQERREASERSFSERRGAAAPAPELLVA